MTTSTRRRHVVTPTDEITWASLTMSGRIRPWIVAGAQLPQYGVHPNGRVYLRGLCRDYNDGGTSNPFALFPAGLIPAYGQTVSSVISASTGRVAINVWGTPGIGTGNVGLAALVTNGMTFDLTGVSWQGMEAIA